MTSLTSKIALILIQILFFFCAITVLSFLAEVIYLTSQGNPFEPTFNHWVEAELVWRKTLLRLVASSVYVLFRNRRLILNRE